MNSVIECLFYMCRTGGNDTILILFYSYVVVLSSLDIILDVYLIFSELARTIAFVIYFYIFSCNTSHFIYRDEIYCGTSVICFINDHFLLIIY